MAEMTPRMARALELIQQAALDRLPCPTNGDLCAALGVTSEATVSDLVSQMERRGLIVVRRSRTARVVAAPDGSWRTAGEIGEPHVFRGMGAASAARLATSPWNEATDAVLTRLWLQADPVLSARQIAEQMRLTKGSIVSRVRRLRLPMRESVVAARTAAAEPRTPPARRPAAPQPIAEAAPRAVVVSSPRAIVPRRDRVGELLRSPPVVRHRTCQYPTGEVRSPGFRFCEAPTRQGSSYCAEHHAICWRPFQPKAAA